jgi:hypothetical protein
VCPALSEKQSKCSRAQSEITCSCSGKRHFDQPVFVLGVRWPWRHPLVERDKEEDGFVRLGLEETKEGDTVGGARLTIETGSLFTIGIS